MLSMFAESNRLWNRFLQTEYHYPDVEEEEEQCVCFLTVWTFLCHLDTSANDINEASMPVFLAAYSPFHP
jgi:hypothetical protein